MKLLLDQGLPRSAVGRLRELGVEAVHVGEIGMSGAQDTLILEHARHHGYAVVTLDADFHSILAEQQASEPSVVRLRIEGLKRILWRNSWPMS